MTIENDIKNFNEIILKSEYSKATIDNYKDKLNSLRTFCKKHNIEYFDEISLRLYIDSIDKRLENGEIQKEYAGMLRSAAWKFYYFIQSGSSDDYKILNHRTKNSSCNTLNNSSKNIFNEFEKFIKLNYANTSIRRYKIVVSRFLHYLEDTNINIYDITSTIIRDYIVFISPSRPNSLDSLIDGLKVFLYYLYDNKYFDWPVRLMRFHIAPSHKKIPVVYSKDEVEKLLNIINIDSSIGKRDYAAILLSLYTGLRSIDVRFIKLENIDWIHDEIHIIQHKTNREIKIPLLPIVGNAIIDYLLNGRPKSNERYIFLSHNRKNLGEMMGTHVLINRITYYLNESGVKTKGNDGKDFHALRRTFATNLLLSGTPLESVSNALGDAGIQAAKPYLSINDELLRECCVKTMRYPCVKENLNA